MDAGSIDLEAVWPRAASPIRVRLTAWFFRLLFVALALSTLLIAGRRLAGGLEHPLSPATMTLAATLAALLAAGSRFALPALSFPDRRAAYLIRWLPAVLLAIFLAALWIPGTSTAALAMTLSIAVAEELLAWQRFRTIAPRAKISLPPPSRQETIIAPLTDPAPPLAVSRVGAAPPAEQPLAPPLLAPQSQSRSPEVVQQQTRSHLANGVDRLTGWLQMSLATSERNATAHVAFCPPFLETPKISLRQMSGPAGRIRAVQILPHGVRLEMKLDLSPRQPQRVSVEFVAETRAT